ncbi:class I SAM-dependent methyltransferase [Frankia sp. CiP3]|uniref:class I SAM-dependent methyltransferase n=2 Tax=unclassified Frankia TaxID=2632575 RepID=UPI001EF71900|nr:class I SAM-dependent methyltransferase [Frankia sp. CiP3]
MDASGMFGVFGPAAPWAASFAGVITTGLVVTGFWQGRSISIWPPRIGRRFGVVQTGMAAWKPKAGSPAEIDQNSVLRREYGVDRAQDFYQEIASNYDLRNSGNLVSTHLTTVAQLQTIREQKSILRILDLGGGTGKLIAIHFFNEEEITWTYIDSCPAMAAEFRRNLCGYPLGRKSEVVVDDLNRALPQLDAGSYDVIVMSLVLSSMAEPPDFALLERLLSPDGSLIITDINPGYTRDAPLYKVWVDGTIVALRTRPVDPFEVIRQASTANLQMTELKTIGGDSTYYSFLTVFRSNGIRSTDAAGDGHQRSVHRRLAPGP